jgi:F-type H+-transporting ATPase subunit delta
MIRFDVAERYAQALYRTPASWEDKVARKETLMTVARMWKTHPSFAYFFLNPEIGKEEKSHLLAKGIKDPQLIHFLILILKKGKIKFLPEIASKYERLVTAASDSLVVTLVTARQASDRLKKNMQEQLEKKLGKSVVLVEKKDAKILGGVVLIFENKLVDFSIAHRLEGLKHFLLRKKYAQA